MIRHFQLLLFISPQPQTLFRVLAHFVTTLEAQLSSSRYDAITITMGVNFKYRTSRKNRIRAT